MCNLRTVSIFFIQFNVEMFSNVDVVFFHYNYFTELASLIAYILATKSFEIFSDSPQYCSACYSNKKLIKYYKTTIIHYKMFTFHFDVL